MSSATAVLLLALCSLLGTSRGQSDDIILPTASGDDGNMPFRPYAWRPADCMSCAYVYSFCMFFVLRLGYKQCSFPLVFTAAAGENGANYSFACINYLHWRCQGPVVLYHDKMHTLYGP